MKLTFVSIEDSITAIGFRKMAAIARQIHPETQVSYIVPTGKRAFLKLIFRKDASEPTMSNDDIKNIGDYLAGFDMVCFSSMTPFADITKQIIATIRAINSKTYVVWGGVHPILYPDDAIQFSNAICVGEGEFAFKNFLYAYEKDHDYTATKNFWFNINGNIIRNAFLPLLTSEEMEKCPSPLYASDELIYKKGRGFMPLSTSEYLLFNDITYTTVWTIGCPFKCTFCHNSKLIKMDRNYAKLRHPSVDYKIKEIKSVLEKHPYISLVKFYDDSFIALPSNVLTEFADKWKTEINLPFWIFGMIPVYMKRDKMKYLVWAGMSRAKMGIQSGSDKILKFYKRFDRPGLNAKSISIMSEFSKFMLAPIYDIIVDNPIETKDDIVATLQMFYDSPRPYRLYIHSLRILPDSEMERDFAALNIFPEDIGSILGNVKPTLANAMFHLLSVFKPPKWLFSLVIKHIRPYERTPRASIFFNIAYYLYKARLFLDRIIAMDFSVLLGKFGWILWKLGIVGFIQRRRMKKAYSGIMLN
ncbi:MAG: radical SAM protein [Smithellaceae bacterium]|jgi:radical SAM superfamily enzyme YgiQ (UPF0313 family)